MEVEENNPIRLESNTIEQESYQEKKFIPKQERWGFAIAAVGQGAIYAMMSSWVGRFFTDVVGIDLLVVTIILWTARFVDAVFNPIMGTIVDRTRTKYGKMRPYLFGTPILICILTILLFTNFNFSSTGKIIYSATILIVWELVYTTVDVPFWGLPVAMTPNEKERSSFISFSRLLNSIGGALPVVLVSVVMADNVWGLSKGISYSAIIFSAIAIIPFTMTFFITKERIVPQKEKQNFKQSMKLLKKNTPLLLILLFGILCFGRYMIQAGYSYAADYVFTFPSVDSIFYKQRQLIGAALIGIGMFPAMLITPKLMRKFEYKNLVIGAGLVSGAVLILFFIIEILTNFNFFVALPFLFVGGMPLGVFNIITASLVADSIDYLEWKEGVRTEGLGMSCNSFAQRMGAALAAGGIPLILKLFDYIQPIKGENGNAIMQQQSKKTRIAILAVISLVPAISFLLSTIPMFFYKYTGKVKQECLQHLDKSRQISEN